MTNWNERFLALAAHIAGWSKDPSTRVGAVIVRPDRTIASVGYNGFARGVEDYPGRYADREAKLRCVVHAEANAILTAREPLHGYSIYVAAPWVCSGCTALIIQSGISHIVRFSGEIPDRWKEDAGWSATQIAEARIRCEEVGPSKPVMCDCERGHNGLGIAGRLCDCLENSGT